MEELNVNDFIENPAILSGLEHFYETDPTDTSDKQNKTYESSSAITTGSSRNNKKAPNINLIGFSDSGEPNYGTNASTSTGIKNRIKTEEIPVPKIPAEYKTKANVFDNLFSCSSLDSFISSIQLVLPYGGYSQSKFFICSWKGVTFLTKLIFYRKTIPELYLEGADQTDAVLGPDSEIAILEILKHEIINKNISPCILEIIYHKKCASDVYSHINKKTCEALIKSAKPKQNIYEIVRSYFCWHYFMMTIKFDYKYFSFIVLEECGPSLRRYINSINSGDSIMIEVLRSIFFQIVYTMHRIKKIYPQFKHNDFHSDNILLKFDPNFKPLESQKYLIFNDTTEPVNLTKGSGRSESLNAVPCYVVPYYGVIAKIIDFGFSSIPELGIRSNIELDKYTMFTRTCTDMIFLLHDILRTTRAQEIDEVMDMLYQMDSGECFLSSVFYMEENKHNIFSTQADHSHEFSDVLQREIFDPYRNKPKPSNIYHEYN